MKPIFAILSLAALLMAAPQAPVMAYGGDGSGSNYSSNTGLSNAVTNRVIRRLTGGVKACQRLPWNYRYDCYRVSYKSASDMIAGNKAYAEAAKILKDVEKSLGRTVQRNLDQTLPTKRRGLQTYRAIKPSSGPAAKREFTRALEQAETRLLRSAGGGNEHFTRIAGALNSNKVLIRSTQAALIRLAMLMGWRAA